ncbi:transcriptional repressor LexA [Candidatus Peregrinibacteria bacterium]|nr:transcriptional repressor LexA [Candidatus Peregrinibacteria bacterium]
MEEYLTEKQEAVLSFIEDYQLSYGKSPTIREMKEHFQLSSDNSILKHIKALQEKGYLEKDDTPRGIKLLNSVKEKLNLADEAVSLPVLGFIPAGGPVLSEEYIQAHITVGQEIAKNDKDFFILKVSGDSMIDAGIFEDDLVIVNSKTRPKSGDIVVALIDNENTLKRFIKEGNNTYLKAENKKYKKIYPVNELKVQGVVSSLIRQY